MIVTASRPRDPAWRPGRDGRSALARHAYAGLTNGRHVGHRVISSGHPVGVLTADRLQITGIRCRARTSSAAVNLAVTPVDTLLGHDLIICDELGFAAEMVLVRVPLAQAFAHARCAIVSCRSEHLGPGVGCSAYVLKQCVHFFRHRSS
jgi:hypothetical protein